MESVDTLMGKVLAHPEVEISGDQGTKQLLRWIDERFTKELDEELSIGSLMRAQHALMMRLMEHAEEKDREWYAPTIASLAWWQEPERFLLATNRSVRDYLDWSYLPKDHPLRRGTGGMTLRELFDQHPYTIIAPILRAVRNTRH